LPDDQGLYVQDDGPGVPPEDRDAVFRYGHSEREAGTGFGLAIVESIVEAHGWTVTLTDGSDGVTTSEASGGSDERRSFGGARFEVTVVS
jgi:signal transduction histidine kinase